MEQPVILFDGVCNLCNGVVKLVIRQDKKGHFKFAALQSAAGQKLLENHQLPQKEFESFLLIQNGRVYQQSDAALQVARRFSWYWQWVQVLWLVPRPLRNAVYRFIARNRYRWFGKQEACMLPTPSNKQRFLEA
jgi:predicted DCC family thiol-disulfide oxidoreductase YuxK